MSRPQFFQAIFISHNHCYRFLRWLLGVVSLLAPVASTTEARLVNTLTSTSLTSRSRVISALGRYNQKCSVVENECV
jgi:hypothetical protein